MKELTFNEWQNHLTIQLKKDYKKLNYSAKIYSPFKHKQNAKSKKNY